MLHMTYFSLGKLEVLKQKSGLMSLQQKTKFWKKFIGLYSLSHSHFPQPSKNINVLIPIVNRIKKHNKN